MATLTSIPLGATSKAPQYGTERSLRASAILTMAQVVGENDLDAQAADEVELVADFTVGGSTGCRIRVETSDDLATWIQQSVFDAATGNLTRLEVTISDTSIRSFRFSPGRRYVRIYAIALTAAAATLLSVTGRAIHSARSFA